MAERLAAHSRSQPRSATTSASSVRRCIHCSSRSRPVGRAVLGARGASRLRGRDVIAVAWLSALPRALRRDHRRMARRLLADVVVVGRDDGHRTCRSSARDDGACWSSRQADSRRSSRRVNSATRHAASARAWFRRRLARPLDVALRGAAPRLVASRRLGWRAALIVLGRGHHRLLIVFISREGAARRRREPARMELAARRAGTADAGNR